MRFSLRTLMVVMLLGGPICAAGWWGWQEWQAYRRWVHSRRYIENQQEILRSPHVSSRDIKD